jgi:hypothetical protein
MPRQLTDRERTAIVKLDKLSGQDPETDHGEADDILLELVHPDVKAAYERLAKSRAIWWVTA